eukprot:4857118-Ditylum_brightwellii.AAC.1
MKSPAMLPVFSTNNRAISEADRGCEVDPPLTDLVEADPVEASTELTDLASSLLVAADSMPYTTPPIPILLIPKN